MTKNDDGLDVPDFLRVTPEEAERRRRSWIENPPRPVMIAEPKKADPDTARVLAEIEAEKKLRAKNRKEKKEALRLQALEHTKGKVWDTTRCRWLDPQESTMSKGAVLVEKYNALVTLAVAAGIKAEPTKKFKDIATGQARIKKLEDQLNGHKAPRKEEHKATGILAEFRKRPGTNLERLLLALDKERGRQVSKEKLCVAVYGKAGEEGALTMVMKGLVLACPKQYEIRKEEGSYGLYDK